MFWWELFNLTKPEVIDEYRKQCNEIRGLKEVNESLRYELKKMEEEVERRKETLSMLKIEWNDLRLKLFERDKEIKSLKHMLDRLEDEK